LQINLGVVRLPRDLSAGCMLTCDDVLHALLQVTAAKAALEVALARATQQRSAYEPYRDMAQYDHQLDLASLAPAYKATCAMAAKALTGQPTVMHQHAEEQLMCCGIQQPGGLLACLLTYMAWV
jgi:hypothetical protein